jgi:periodic tryptophan protein 2
LAPFVHVKNFTGHYDDVTSIQWSANSKLLLTSSKDLSAKLFNLGKPKKNFPLTLSGHRDNVVNSFFSKDGTSIYTVSRDGQVCHWKNTTLMSVLEDKGVEIEDRGDNDYLEESKWMVTERHYLEQPGKVTSATFHTDTSMLLVGFDNGIFGLWEMPDFVNIHTLSISQHRINTVAVNNTGEWLAFGSSEFGQLLVWEWQSESYILKQQGHFYDMNTMAYSPDGQTIATGGHDGKLKVWNTTSGFCFVTFTDHSAPITALEFTKNGQVIISASLDGTVRAFDLKRYRNFRTFTSPSPAQFSCMTVDPSGDIICAGSNDTFEIYVWSLQTGRLLEVLAGHEAPVSGISFSPNHNIFASGSWDKTVRIWDIFGRTHYTESIQMKAEVLSLAYRPDGKQLAASTLDGEISFWDSDSGNNMGAIEGRKDISGGRKDNDMISAANSSAGKSFNSLCYTADGKAIIGGGNSKYVCIYDCLTHVLIKKFQITHNRSLDGTLEFLNSKNMTDAGPMDLVDDEDDDRDIAFRKGSHNLPGVVKGDLSDRKVKPEAKTKSVKFCPTGRSWAAASTEGLLIYSLDDTLVFDPFELEMDITPDSVLSTLTNKQYLHALIMAFKLNEPQVTVKVFESIPSSDIPLISSQLPEKYLPMALKFLITYSESGSPHLEFIILWTLELFTHHGRTLKSNLNLHLPNIRGIQKVLTKRYQDLSKL